MISTESAKWRAGRSLMEGGIVSPRLPVPAHILKPDYVTTGKPGRETDYQIHNAEGIRAMRYSSKKAAEALAFAGSLVAPGVTGDYIDRKVHEYIISMGCYPSPLGYGTPPNTFPKSICFSVNEIICHGIPDDVELMDGDIVSIDVSLFTPYGTHGDNCATFLCGNVDESGKKLVKVSKECLDNGISVCREGQSIAAVGHAIADIYEKHGYQSCREFSGHGVGHIFHRAPWVYHYRNNAKQLPMVAGMTFTIEPMIMEGSATIGIWEDDWTISTQDFSRCSQFEHTVLITKDGCEILTVV